MWVVVGEGGPVGHEPGATICRIDTRYRGGIVDLLDPGQLSKVSQLLVKY